MFLFFIFRICYSLKYFKLKIFLAFQCPPTMSEKRAHFLHLHPPEMHETKGGDNPISYPFHYFKACPTLQLYQPFLLCEL